MNTQKLKPIQSQIAKVWGVFNIESRVEQQYILNEKKYNSYKPKMGEIHMYYENHFRT